MPRFGISQSTASPGPPPRPTPIPERRLYLDATVGFRGESTKTVVFGPFVDNASAEQALIAFVGRENAMGAVIRDPNG